MVIRPVLDHIIVVRVEQPAPTVGVIHRVNPEAPALRYGKVIGVGPGRVGPRGDLISPPCDVGDTVIYHGGAGALLKAETGECWFLSPNDVLAVVVEP